MFDMRKSNCSKADHKELNDECHPDAEDVELAHCNSTVDVAPWRHETAEANVECAPGPLQNFEVFRRRPPGWSPLRNFNNFAEATPASTASAKEESLEESQELSLTAVTTASRDPEPTMPPTTTAESPFHCPSKPWTQFVPLTIPSPAQEKSTTPPTVVEGCFSDLDLLGKK